MDEQGDLSASMEDYLETIFLLVEDNKVARARDIAKRLQVNSSSVTGALRVLARKQLINYAPYEIITMTPLGEQVAASILRRHNSLRDFLVTVLAVDRKQAEGAACRMEHAVPRGVLERLAQFADFVQACPQTGPELLDSFRRHCEEA